MPCLLLNALSLSLLFYLKPFRFSIPLSEETSKTNLSSLSLSLSLRKLLNLFRPHFNAEAFVLSRTWRHSGKEELSLSWCWSSYVQLSVFDCCAKNCHLNSDASTNYHVHKEVKSTFPEDRMQSHSYFVSSFFLIIFIDRGKLNS
ncbi:hypothetical protein AAZX31_13G247500 [Glycine max]